MDSATVTALDAITREFYQAVGTEFSASRSRLNRGIQEAFEDLDPPRTILDAGCGDGRVGLAWAAGELPIPWTPGCRYVGFDRSRELLEARAPWPAGLQAIEGDLMGPWPEGPFEVVCCFAALHHIPGRAARRELLTRIAGMLAPGGTWILSVWQFLHLERYQRRLVDWADAGIDPHDLEAGDLLLDWRRGPRALRYVHHYQLDELVEDCDAAGLRVGRGWSADEGLGLYLKGLSSA